MARVSEIVRHLFGQEWIVRDVWLRLLRELVGVVPLVQPASLMISGSASCRAQRTFALRCVHHAMPLAATSERDDRGRDPRAARRPRPRDAPVAVRTTPAARDTPTRDRARSMP